MTMQFNIDKQTARRTDTQTIVANSLNYLFAEFSFSDDWKNKIKVATFSALINGSTQSFNVTLVGDICKVPYQVIKEGSFYVSVHSVDTVLITVNECKITVTKSGGVTGENPGEPDEVEEFIKTPADKPVKLIKYENGEAQFYNGTEWISMKGDEGKTAYEAALEGGYEGTEEAFNIELASIKLKADAEDVYTKNETFTKGEVTQKIADLVNAAPGALDTLKEIATALGNDPNFATTIINLLAQETLSRSQGDAATLSASKIYSNGIVDDAKSEVNELTDDKITASKVATIEEANEYTDGVIDELETSQNAKLLLKANAATTYTKDEVATLISDVVNGSPELLDTLFEISNAIGNDANFASTIMTLMGTKASQVTTYTKTEVNMIAETKAPQASTYTKTEVDNADALKLNKDFSQFVTDDLTGNTVLATSGGKKTLLSSIGTFILSVFNLANGLLTTDSKNIAGAINELDSKKLDKTFISTVVNNNDTSSPTGKAVTDFVNGKSNSFATYIFGAGSSPMAGTAIVDYATNDELITHAGHTFIDGDIVEVTAGTGAIPTSTELPKFVLAGTNIDGKAIAFVTSSVLGVSYKLRRTYDAGTANMKFTANGTAGWLVTKIGTLGVNTFTSIAVNIPADVRQFSVILDGWTVRSALSNQGIHIYTFNSNVSAMYTTLRNGNSAILNGVGNLYGASNYITGATNNYARVIGTYTFNKISATKWVGKGDFLSHAFNVLATPANGNAVTNKYAVGNGIVNLDTIVNITIINVSQAPINGFTVDFIR